MATASFSKHTQFLAAFAASLGALSLGTILVWPSYRTDVEENHVYDSNYTEWSVHIVLVGAIVSSPITGFLIGWLGRKRTTLLMATPCTLGWLLVAFSKNSDLGLAGRFFTGVSGGAFSLVVPIYICEIADKEHRGLLASGFQLMIAVASLFMLNFRDTVTSSQVAIICSVIPVILMVMMFFMPESPYWFGKIQGCGKISSRSSNLGTPVELQGVESSAQIGERKNYTTLNHASFWKPILVCLLLFLFQRISGINAILFYVRYSFMDSGLDIDFKTADNIVFSAQLLAIFISLLAIDKFGRKPLLVISQGGMLFSLVGLGILFNTATVPGAWPLIFTLISIFSYSLGMQGIPFIIFGEILSTRAKGFAASIVISFYWILSLLTDIDPLELRIDLSILYFVYAVICGIGIVLIAKFVPETKSKSFPEIQEIFTVRLNLPTNQFRGSGFGQNNIVYKEEDFEKK